jgi:hypothetical protein
MTKLEQIKQNYSRALENYRIKYPVLHPADKQRINHICVLCGASVPGTFLTEHMSRHEILPEPGLQYQLTQPFARINGLIQRGAKFIKLLYLVKPDQAVSVPYNALNLPDWSKVTDTNETRVRWSAKKKRFIRTLWVIIILINL